MFSADNKDLSLDSKFRISIKDQIGSRKVSLEVFSWTTVEVHSLLESRNSKA